MLKSLLDAFLGSFLSIVNYTKKKKMKIYHFFFFFFYNEINKVTN